MKNIRTLQKNRCLFWMFNIKFTTYVHEFFKKISKIYFYYDKRICILNQQGFCYKSKFSTIIIFWWINIINFNLIFVFIIQSLVNNKMNLKLNQGIILWSPTFYPHKLSPSANFLFMANLSISFLRKFKSSICSSLKNK